MTRTAEKFAEELAEKDHVHDTSVINEACVLTVGNDSDPDVFKASDWRVGSHVLDQKGNRLYVWVPMDIEDHLEADE